MTQPRISLSSMRPDLRWAEEILGESLQAPAPGLPDLGTANAALSADVIPMGEHCYYPQPMVTGHVPCPYFSYTPHGSVKCAYLAVEAYDPHDCDNQRQVESHFGGSAEAEAAGVVGSFYLTDSIKVCGVNLLYPGYVKHNLEPAIRAYGQAVEAQPVRFAPADPRSAQATADSELWLQDVALDRFELWELLTSMVEAVPSDCIKRISIADKRFRAKTAPADELMADDMAGWLPAYPNPKKQFWYLHRKNFS